MEHDRHEERDRQLPAHLELLLGCSAASVCGGLEAVMVPCVCAQLLAGSHILLAQRLVLLMQTGMRQQPDSQQQHIMELMDIGTNLRVDAALLPHAQFQRTEMAKLICHLTGLL